MHASAVTVLTYHALVEQPGELDSIPPGSRLYVFTVDEFRRHLDHLAAEAFATIALADFVRWHQVGHAARVPNQSDTRAADAASAGPRCPPLPVGSGAFGVRRAARRPCRYVGGAELPERPVVLSFDDGHRSNATLALPALAERGQRAIFFVTAGRVGSDCGLRIADCGFQPETRNPEPVTRPPEGWMTWGDLRSLLQAGMEIGSHTLTHRNPSSLSRDELRHELAESKRVLEEGLGAAVDFVASPTGYDSRHFAALAREAGYKAALQGVIGRNTRRTDLFALRRIVLKRSHGFGTFRRLVDPASRAWVALRAKQAARNAVRRVLGARGYEAIRGLFLGKHKAEKGG